MHKYFIYCRKSTDERSEKQTPSNPAQEQELKTKAKREGLDCVNFQMPYKEERTAFKPGRELFNEMLNRIENGETNAILVWELSRLSRNPLDTGRLRWLMGEGKLKEIRTKDKIYTDIDSLLMDIEFAMANKESKQTSERTKRNLLFKARDRKEWPGWATIGYLNVNENKLIAGKGFDKKKQDLIEKQAKCEKRPLRRIELDPILGPLIQKLFDTFSTGLYSLEMVIEVSYKWGLRNRRGKPLCKSTVARLLSNPFYYGMFVFHGELYEGNHEPIITKSLFDKAQKILREKSKPLTRHRNFLFSGLIKCGECGCAVCGDLKKDKYELYRCTLKRRYINCSQRHHVSREEIERQLTEEVKKLTINDMIYELLMLNLKSQNQKEKRLHVGGLDHWQRVERHCEERISRLLDALADGLIAREEFLEKKNEILNQKTEAKEKIKYHRVAVKSWHDYAENLLIRVHHIYEIFAEGALEDKKALLKTIGENYKLKDGLVTFDLRPPYNFIEAINKTKSSSLSQVLGGLDALRTFLERNFFDLGLINDLL